MDADEVRARLRAAVGASKSAAAWARDHDVSPQFVSDVLLGNRDPGDKVLAALGLERIITFQEKTGGNQTDAREGQESNAEEG